MWIPEAIEFHERQRCNAAAEGAPRSSRNFVPSHFRKSFVDMRGAIAIALSSIVIGGFSSSTAAKTYRWNCVYTQVASPKGLLNERFSLEFAFDDITERAVMIGNQGVADVEVHRGPLSVTFMEKLSGGVVQTTTVTNDGKSVHSRHTVMGKEMMPTQYYGQCSVR
jgi:hypothetical protein